MIFIYLLVAGLSFAVGFLLGEKPKPLIKPKPKKGTLAATENLRREYENFLNYDGSEQS